jgi:hypothetical protein
MHAGPTDARGRADGRARRGRRTRAALPMDARGGANGRVRRGQRTRAAGPTVGADGRARRCRWTRAAGPTDACGGANGRARRGRRTRAAGPKDARGGADGRAPRPNLESLQLGFNLCSPISYCHFRGRGVCILQGRKKLDGCKHSQLNYNQSAQS